MKKKKRNIDLKTLWARHAKSQKIALSSTPKQVAVKCEVDGNSPCILPREITPSFQQQEQNVSDNENEMGAVEMYDVDLLPPDPGMRIPITSYNANEQDAVRRGYIALGPCQTQRHSFPQRKIGRGMHYFVASWFDRYDWLEYSVERDAAFCFVCYLFKDRTTCTGGGGDDFVSGGFRNWNEPDKFERHISGINSAHNQAQEKYNLFVKSGAIIVDHLDKRSTQDKILSKTQLIHSLKCLRCLLHQGLACCGHNEEPESSYGGSFLELLNELDENFEDVAKVVLKHAPMNNKMTDPCIQKDIINCFAKETTKLIIDELGDDCFSILACESNDLSQKEHLALCVRYVDKSGKAVERFLGAVNVEDTTALTLKSAIRSLLMDHSLSLSKIRGQGYYSASNMEVSKLRKLIMDEVPSAYYINCFTRQLHSILVDVAKENDDCVWFFEQLKLLLNIIGISCKKQHLFQAAQAQ